MRSARCSSTVAVALAVAFAACGRARTSAGAPGGELATCTRCHGDAANGNAAPPPSLLGGTDPSDPRVGAHQAHLNTGALRQAVACGECHVVPTAVSSPGHMNGSVDIAFGPLAGAQGAATSWEPTTTTCATYCHGATLPGGSNTRPVWTYGPSQAACGTCHGVPPPPASGHPAITGGVTACSACHPATVKADGTIDVAGGRHINGTVDVAGGGSCTSCHGDPNRALAAIAAAPPRGTHGETATSARAVGAHQTHLTGGAVRAALACSECHAVPTSVPHANGRVDLTWGPLASAGGAAPSFDGIGCNSVYCHGATLGAGGTATAPIWTKVDGTQNACGSCHAIPPPVSSGHPAITGGVTACSACHPATVKANGTIDVAGGKHINGTVDVVGGGSCTSCHGDATRTAAIAAAPPRGTHGETATSARAVGAHQTHLTSGAVRAAVACSECHAVPTSVPHANGRVDLTWGPLASADGAAPSFDGIGCNSVYCHGATLGAGGTATVPIWTKVDGTQNACGSCHAIPPPVSSGHPAVPSGRTACAACHPQTVKADGTIDVAGGKHINGTVDIAGGGSCTACHGDPNRAQAAIAAAPPRDTAGRTDSDAVGAHLAHLQGGAIRGAMACNDCHTVPGDTAHSTQPLDLTWGALARTGGVTPSWNAATLTCANYCHGVTLPGGTDTTPVWNLGASQAACGTCHGLPPPMASGHPAVAGSGTAVCAGCHPDTVTSGGVIDVAKGKHIDGVLEVANLSCTSCHGGTLSGGTGASGANPVAAAPPRGTKGETATSARAVGLHANHLTSQRFTTSVTCASCHVVPASTSHSNGTATVTFGGLATTGGAAPVWNGASCSASYCHGSFTGGAGANPVTWANATVPAIGCTSCHGIAPATGQHNRHLSRRLADCVDCHGTGYSASTVNTALHLNGAKNVGGTGSRINSWNPGTLTCAPACHGSERW
jgi:predicted CxxxxCH...CXXCH cytochrome family protein